ncbi:helix-turn-helix domain-containing protein [Nocardia neocaledoniensis]|uniref:helix-turn-helix domain-containing protein n=1 Tax=Nocardia neocaledoniensis TaxID=236511 RepID=UPI0033D31CE8
MSAPMNPHPLAGAGGHLAHVRSGWPSAGWDFATPAVARPGVSMIGYRDVVGGGVDLRVAATTAVAIVIEFGGGDLIVDDTGGRQALGAFVVGLPMDTARVCAERAQCVEVRLSPVLAYHLLDTAPKDLGAGVISAEALWGGRVRRLREQLTLADTWGQRFALTNAFLAQGTHARRAIDPEVIAAWRLVLDSGGQVRVDALAASLGWSRKRLWSRFEAQIGLTPKRAAMLVRFRRAVDGLLAGRPAADVAAACGYTDQAHLSRDVAIFADRTPGALQTGKLPAIAVGRHRAWGTFFQSSAGPLGR